MTGGWKCGSPDALHLLVVHRLGRVDVALHEVEQLLLEPGGGRAEGEIHELPVYTTFPCDTSAAAGGGGADGGVR